MCCFLLRAGDEEQIEKCRLGPKLRMLRVESSKTDRPGKGVVWCLKRASHPVSPISINMLFRICLIKESLPI